MNETPRLNRLAELLDEVFRDRHRVSAEELQQRAAGLDLSPRLTALFSMAPGGEYDRDRAEAELTRIEQEEGMWRDESRLPLAELHRAIATSGTEGQFDDPTGHEAGPAEEFGGQQWPGPAGTDGDPEPGSVADRRLRPSPEGRSGPH